MKKNKTPSEIDVGHQADLGRVAELGLLCAACVGLCFSIWIPGDSTSVATGSVIPQTAYWLTVGCGWVGILLRQHLHHSKLGASQRASENGFSLWHRSLLAVTCLVIGWLFLSVWRVHGEGNLRAAVNVAWQWIACMVALAVLNRLGRYEWSRLAIAALLVSLGWMVTLHSLYQYQISMPATRAEFRADPVGSLAKVDIHAPPGSDIYMQYASRLESSEPLGPYALTNSLAGLYVLVLLLGLAWLVELRKEDRWARWSLIAFLLLGVFCFALTKSRGGWLALATAMAGYAFSRSGGYSILYRNRSWLAIASVLCIGLLGLVYATDPLVLLEAPKSLAFRWQYWESTMAMIRDHFWFGVGPGNFQNYYPEYKSAIASETIADPHCFPLEIAATVGLPGLCWSCLGMLLFAAKPWFDRHSNSLQPMANSFPEPSNHTTGMNAPFTNIESTRTQRFPWSNAIVATWLAAAIVWGLPELIGTPPDWFPYLIGLPSGTLLMSLPLSRRSSSTGSAAREHALHEHHGTEAMQSAPSGLAWRWSAIGMALHLLVNGGWLTPGNMLPWITAVAFGFTSLTPSMNFGMASTRNEVPSSPFVRRQPLFVAALSIALGCTMMLFVWTAWWPWQAFHPWKTTQHPSPQAWLLSAEKVAQSDRWNPAPSQAMVDFLYRAAYESYRRSPRSTAAAQDREEWLAAQNELRNRNPHDWQYFQRFGRQQWALMSNVEEANLVVSHYQQAIERYPSEVGMRIELAAILFQMGKDDDSRIQCKQAFELDNATPHFNRKLGAVMVQIHFPGVLSDSNGRIQLFRQKLGPGSQTQGTEDWYRAEPVAQYLRSQLFPAGEMP